MAMPNQNQLHQARCQSTSKETTVPRMLSFVSIQGMGPHRYTDLSSLSLLPPYQAISNMATSSGIIKGHRHLQMSGVLPALQTNLPCPIFPYISLWITLPPFPP